MASYPPERGRRSATANPRWSTSWSRTFDQARDHGIHVLDALRRVAGIDQVVGQSVRLGELERVDTGAVLPPRLDEAVGEAVVEPWLGGVGDDDDPARPGRGSARRRDELAAAI